MSVDQQVAHREYTDEGVQLDIEREDTSHDEEEFHDYVKPWDPESIRVSTKTFSVRNILDLVDEDSIELQPDFQRLRVWKMKQKAQLIESIILQIPLPAFYFAEDRDGSMRVVDGLQRLSTIHDFVRGGNASGFKLQQLEYIDDVQGQSFDELPAPIKRRIYNTQLVVHVIDPTTPPAVKYDIFRRINTGGTTLTSQEIRHCMSRSRSREFLQKQTSTDLFQEATGYSLENNNRMVDREVVLRFVAFYMMGNIENYRRAGTMEDLLWRTTEHLDDPKEVSDQKLQELGASLAVGLKLSLVVFGEHAFRKWTQASSRRSPFNRALFETWTTQLATRDPDKVTEKANEIANRAMKLMESDFEFMSAITSSTGDPKKVEYRFRAVDKLLEDVLK